MTVEIQANWVRHQGNNIATKFPYTFRIPEFSMVKVSLQDAASGVIIRDLDPGEYTITGVSQDNYAGGEVTYPLSGPPLSENFYLLLQRIAPFKQELDIENQGGFYPESVEYQLDKIVFQIQQLRTATEGAVMVPPGVTPPSVEQLNQWVIDTQEAASSAQQSAQEASDDADQTAADRVQTGLDKAAAIEAAGYAVDAANEAMDARDTAVDAKNSALVSADKADKWANNPENVPVESGKFSAYHWSKKAEEAASGGMQPAMYDPQGVQADAFSMDNMAEGADTKIMTAAERAAISANTDARHTHSNKAILDGTQQSFTTALKNKLDGIEAGATANQSDAYLLDRANHTGAQAISTVTGLQSSLDSKADKTITISAGTGLSGGGSLTTNITIALSSSSQIAIAAAITAVQPGDLGDLALKDKVAISDIAASGTPSSTTFLRGDGVWSPGGGGGGGGDVVGPSGSTDGEMALFDGASGKLIKGGGLPFSGNYNDLSNKPSIPPAQVNSDWNASNGVAQILNKPDLSGFATTAQLTAGLSGKFDNPTGTTSQYVRGDGSLAAFPAIPAGTVTSVGLSAPTGFTVSGSPVTGSGSLTFAYASGYTGFTTTLKNKLDGIEAGAQVNLPFGTATNTVAEGNKALQYQGALGAGEDLDTYTAPGIYTQNQNAGASGGSNYPAPVAGMLEVLDGGGATNVQTVQRYTEYSQPPIVWQRMRRNGGNWSAWLNLSEWMAETVSQVEAEAGTSTDANVKWSPERVAQAIAALGSNIGGAFTNVTASRAKNTTYQNTTGRWLMVWLSNTNNGLWPQISQNTTFPGSTNPGVQSGGQHYGSQFLVPPGWYYRADMSGTAWEWWEN